MTTNPEVLRLAREVARPFLGRQFSDLDEKNLQAGYLDRSSIVQTAIAAIEKTTELAIALVQNNVPVIQCWSVEPVAEALCETFESLERYDHLSQSEKDNSDAD